MFDIDFLSFWAPSLLALAVEAAPALTLPAALQVFGDAFTAAPVRTALLAAYTTVSVLVSLCVYDLNPRRGELLPFSSYPMFEEAAFMFDKEQALALVLRVPTATAVPEPYYLRMQALAPAAPKRSELDILSGPEVLADVDHRILVVGIPRQAVPNTRK